MTLKLPNGKLLTTKSDTVGKYSFDDVPSMGEFSLTAAHKQFSESIYFNKDIDIVAQEKDIQIPTYLLVQVHFILLKADGTKEEIYDIVNQQMEYEVISTDLKAVYTQNKIFIKREGIAKFSVHSEFLPFKYNVKKISLQTLDTEAV